MGSQFTVNGQGGSASSKTWKNPYEHCANQRDTWQQFVRAMQDFGFDSLIVHIGAQAAYPESGHCSGHSLADPETPELRRMQAQGRLIITCDSIDALTMDHRRRLVSVDPLLQHIQTSHDTVLINADSIPDHHKFSEELRAFYGAGAPLKICSTVFVPVHLRMGDRASGFGLHSRQSAAELESVISECIEHIQLHCHRFAERFSDQQLKRNAEASGLGPKQLRILNYLTHGLSNQEIACRMNVSEPTISFHLKAIRKALNIRTVRELPMAAIRSGLVDVPEA